MPGLRADLHEKIGSFGISGRGHGVNPDIRIGFSGNGRSDLIAEFAQEFDHLEEAREVCQWRLGLR